jgi:predicted CDP-diglyceride synthetase/phosphatidate cytidylyltransferase
MDRTVEFILHGVCGAVFAAVIAVGLLWWLTDINWLIIAIAAVAGFLVAGFFGEPAFEWMKKLWDLW